MVFNATIEDEEKHEEAHISCLKLLCSLYTKPEAHNVVDEGTNYDDGDKSLEAIKGILEESKDAKPHELPKKLPKIREVDHKFKLVPWTVATCQGNIA
ncbi:hypothetical protein RJ639_014576 [Escallonia herrerae]|uniref:Uncharacterized protein n=1 Tax=Escallonia herrerae TaxID=1293975 RepID=A0AA88VH37_9ASTE|nr:hypothetical protein RJ639_014576 [Escallonia herrerae]